MRVFRFLFPAALAALLALCVPGLSSGGAVAEACASPSPADAPEDGETVERLVAGAVRLALLPVEALSRALTACEEKQGGETPGWIREGTQLLRAFVKELKAFLPAGPEDSNGLDPESDVSVIRPSPACKLRLV